MSEAAEPASVTAPVRGGAVAFIFVTILLDMFALGLIMPILPKLVESFLDNDTASAARVFLRFCEAIGRKDWREREEWKTQAGRSRDRKAINAAIGEITRTQPSEHWIELFEANGIPCGPIYSIDQVFADPQVKHLGMATTMHSPHVGEKEVVASALNISGFSKAIRAHTPDAGEHGDEILKGVGYTDAELADMRQKGVI